MKKLLTSVLLLFAITNNSFAYSTGGGFVDNTTVQTVAETLKKPDDAYVILQGNIIKRLGSEEYLFQDATGKITIEIDDDKWLGQTISPNDKIEITGEIDKEFYSIKIDVNSVKKLAK